ncbi:CHAP domain-containing protein [Staphylococcus sp. SQ8-PEA]|uniref:CHAP domain-containing protein n=1 Tax=Staphylococcus marylandisciuri TaxID=2981529 RepID=A0ABT2QNA0_9STAP|nr:CHAP domain-containing protein [Staphylococcus marylandisciuri]MCU5745450.1 CHAP domain-containing protein [Staphylococcus marylandisciuri]
MKKKIATASIATAGIATFALAHHDADAAENTNNGYNPNDPTSYSYHYTIDQQGNYHYTWKGNWSPSQAPQQQGQAQQATGYNYNNVNQNNNRYYNYNYTSSNYSNYQPQSYTANNTYTGGKGATYNTNQTSNHNVRVTTQSAPQHNQGGHVFAGRSASGSNLYTSGQCTYYVFDKVGGKIGSTWGDARNWANAAAQSGYTVDNSPKQGAIMQTSQGAFGHVAYVEGVNSDGSVKVSEMNYGHGPGVVTSRTISASQASSYNYIK